MNSNVSSSCFGGCNGENGIIWILVLLLLFSGNGGCSLFNLGGGCGSGIESIIIIIVILSLISGNSLF